MKKATQLRKLQICSRFASIGSAKRRNSGMRWPRSARCASKRWTRMGIVCFARWPTRCTESKTCATSCASAAWSTSWPQRTTSKTSSTRQSTVRSSFTASARARIRCGATISRSRLCRRSTGARSRSTPTRASPCAPSTSRSPTTKTKRCSRSASATTVATTTTPSSARPSSQIATSTQRAFRVSKKTKRFKWLKSRPPPTLRHQQSKRITNPKKKSNRPQNSRMQPSMRRPCPANKTSR